VARSGGLLAIHVSSFRSLFDYLKFKANIPAKQVLKILDSYPEFAMQWRRELLQKKCNLI
jgi:hypothetical protein